MKILGRAVAIHSYKGGTGKSSIAANLAAHYARAGRNTCLLDYDFRAPSLNILFKANPKKWLNGFLDGSCEVEETLVDFSERFKTKGKLIVGFANPSFEAMKEMMTKDRRWEMKALHRTLSAKTTIYSKYHADYILFDTSPGIHYSSVNALAGSDVIALVMKPDEFDMEGTKEMVRGIYNVLGRKTGILLNKITNEALQIQGGQEKLVKTLEGSLDLPIIGMIPWKSDVLATGGRLIHVFDQPDHEFSRAIHNIGEKLEKF